MNEVWESVIKKDIGARTVLLLHNRLMSTLTLWFSQVKFIMFRD